MLILSVGLLGMATGALPMNNLGNRGFAMPVAIFAIVSNLIIVTSMFFTTRQDGRIARAAEASELASSTGSSSCRATSRPRGAATASSGASPSVAASLDNQALVGGSVVQNSTCPSTGHARSRSKAGSTCR